jgi:hypothetical protein
VVVGGGWVIGLRLDDGKWHPFVMKRWFRKSRKQGWNKTHRRRILPDYKQALAWLSPEEWDARLMRYTAPRRPPPPAACGLPQLTSTCAVCVGCAYHSKGRFSDLAQKGSCLPAEMIEHYHNTGFYYTLETWPLQWEASRRRNEACTSAQPPPPPPLRATDRASHLCFV